MMVSRFAALLRHPALGADSTAKLGSPTEQVELASTYGRARKQARPKMLFARVCDAGQTGTRDRPLLFAGCSRIADASRDLVQCSPHTAELLLHRRIKSSVR